jgi:hypothetical protein
VEAEPPRGVAQGAIALVAGHGMAQGGELGADLVLAPRFKGKLEEAVAVALSEHPIARYGPEGVMLAGLGLAHAARAGLDEPGLDPPLVIGELPLDECLVEPLARQLVPSRHDDGLGLGRFGEDEGA